MYIVGDISFLDDVGVDVKLLDDVISDTKIDLPTQQMADGCSSSPLHPHHVFH